MHSKNYFMEWDESIRDIDTDEEAIGAFDYEFSRRLRVKKIFQE